MDGITPKLRLSRDTESECCILAEDTTVLNEAARTTLNCRSITISDSAGNVLDPAPLSQITELSYTSTPAVGNIYTITVQTNDGPQTFSYTVLASDVVSPGGDITASEAESLTKRNVSKKLAALAAGLDECDSIFLIQFDECATNLAGTLTVRGTVPGLPLTISWQKQVTDGDPATDETQTDTQAVNCDDFALSKPNYKRYCIESDGIYTGTLLYSAGKPAGNTIEFAIRPTSVENFSGTLTVIQTTTTGVITFSAGDDVSTIPIGAYVAFGDGTQASVGTYGYVTSATSSTLTVSLLSGTLGNNSGLTGKVAISPGVAPYQLYLQGTPLPPISFNWRGTLSATGIALANAFNKAVSAFGYSTTDIFMSFSGSRVVLYISDQFLTDNNIPSIGNVTILERKVSYSSGGSPQVVQTSGNIGTVDPWSLTYIYGSWIATTGSAEYKQSCKVYIAMLCSLWCAYLNLQEQIVCGTCALPNACDAESKLRALIETIEYKTACGDTSDAASLLKTANDFVDSLNLPLSC